MNFWEELMNLSSFFLFPGKKHLLIFQNPDNITLLIVLNRNELHQLVKRELDFWAKKVIFPEIDSL